MRLNKQHKSFEFVGFIAVVNLYLEASTHLHRYSSSIDLKNTFEDLSYESGHDRLPLLYFRSLNFCYLIIYPTARGGRGPALLDDPPEPPLHNGPTVRRGPPPPRFGGKCLDQCQDKSLLETCWRLMFSVCDHTV